MTIEQYFDGLSQPERDLHISALLSAANAIAMIVITNESADILAVNSKFQLISEYEISELIGANHRIVRHPDTSNETFIGMWATLTSGNSYVGKFKNKSKHGREYWVHASLFPIKNEAGEIYRYIAIKTDLTNEQSIGKELDYTIRQLSIEKEERIKAQTRLETTVQELQLQSSKNEEQILYLSRTRLRYILVTIVAAIIGGAVSWLIKHSLDVWLLWEMKN